MDLFKEWAKAVAAFVAGVVANMVSDLIAGKSPFPTTPAEWARYVILSVGAAIAVGGTPNKLNEKQVTTGLKKLDPDATERAVNKGAPEVLAAAEKITYADDAEDENT